MNCEHGEQIGNSVGKVVDIDLPNNGIGWGRYLLGYKLKYLWNTLSRGRTICVNGEKTWIFLKNEKLPHTYFLCGCIKYGKNGCLFQEKKNQKGLMKQVYEYGSCLQFVGSIELIC